MVSESRKKRNQKIKASKDALEKKLKAKSEQLIADYATDPLARSFLERRTDFIPANQRILIACEGKKTEPFYFDEMKKAWRIAIDLDLVTAQGDPLSVVRSAVRHADAGYDEIWAVFDKDDFQESKISDAFQLAEENNVKVAYCQSALNFDPPCASKSDPPRSCC